MKNRKLIALDLDGTLLDDQKNISSNTKKYLKELEDRGHIICLTSGRPPRAIKPHYDDIGLKNSPFIGYNGDLIYDVLKDKTTVFKSIPISFISCFFKHFDFYKFPYIAGEDLSHLYLNVADILFDDFLHPDGIQVVVGQMPYTIVNDLEAFFFKTYDNNQDEIKKFTSKHKDVEVRFWYDRPEFGEFYPANISKEVGLKEVAKNYNIEREDIIAFGDGNNDFEMLDFASTSFAMKNGAEKLKQQNKYVTEYTNNEEGVYRQLMKILG